MNTVQLFPRQLFWFSSLALLLCLLPLSPITAQPEPGGEGADTSEFDDFNFENIPTEDPADDNAARTGRLVELSGQVRLRSEIDRRQPLVPEREDATDYHLLRTRVGLMISPIEGVTGFVQAQDSRTFGSSDHSLSIDPTAFDFHQAWFRLDDFLADGVSLKVGRQELAYANERLVGAVGWHNRGRTFDGLKIRSQNSWGSVDLFGARIDEQGSIAGNGSEHLFGLWSTLGNDDHTVDLFVLYDNDNSKFVTETDTAVDRLNRGTYGVRWLGTFTNLTLEAEGAFQNGDQVQPGTVVPNDTGVARSIGAYMASLRAALKAGDFDLGLLYTRLSGDDDPLDDDIGTFNTLYATNHKFYGYMDYFPAGAGGTGLQDIALLLGWRAGDATTLGVDGHYFIPAVDGDPFGTEIDLTVKHRYNSAVNFVFGASMFMPDDGFAGRLGDENGYWGYLMAIVNL